MGSIAPKARGGNERDSGTHRLVDSERRRISRVGVELIVELELADGRRITGVAHDIGLGGMFVESIEALAYGASLVVLLPGSSIRLPATVRWASGSGMGLQFGLLGARETHAVTTLVEHAKGN